jgi:foldase protein PrsA
MVNGEPISRLSVIHDLEAQSGKAALDAMITRALVLQEANKKNINITTQEIDSEIAKIQKQFQSQGQNLDSLLATQGLSKEKFRDEVKIQLVVTKILGNQAKVTDKEFTDFLAKNQDLIASEKDPEAAKVNLRQQMGQQKLAQKYQEWIANIKKTAKINFFVQY